MDLIDEVASAYGGKDRWEQIHRTDIVEADHVDG